MLNKTFRCLEKLITTYLRYIDELTFNKYIRARIARIINEFVYNILTLLLAFNNIKILMRTIFELKTDSF